MRGAIPSFPQYAFMAWCLVKNRGSFTFNGSVDMYKLGAADVLNNWRELTSDDADSLHFVYGTAVFHDSLCM